MRSAIVCVDDEWDILRGLGIQLKRHFGKNYDIELVTSGEDALALCAELTAEGRHIPLIISDQNMRGMAGDVLLIQLHVIYPKTLKIMLTGRADAKSVGNVVNAAALYRYIPKPWDETDLILTVSEALRRFHQDQQFAQQNELLKQTNAKLKSSLSLLLATLEATADGILVLDNTGKVISFNQKFASIWNLLHAESSFYEEDLLSIILERLVEPDFSRFQVLFTHANSQQHDFLHLKNGNIIEYYLHPQQLMGEVVGKVWSVRDVTQEKQSEASIKHQAFHDALTNLPNRTLFNQKLSAALQDAMNQARLIAVMFIDLDRFKEVNDTLGHAVGDLLLQSVVQRMLSCLRETDVLGRWGGDEFVLLLPNLRSREDVNEVAYRLIEVLQPQFCLQGYCVQVTASIGIAVYPDAGQDISTLIQNADSALYQAKNFGRNNYQYC